MKKKFLLIDIDNTVFDWLTYFVHSTEAMFSFVENLTNIPFETLCQESKVVLQKYGSVEFPFLLQELPSVESYYQGDIDRLLDECVEPGRQKFLETAESFLVPYDGVTETLPGLRDEYRIIAITDAPRYVAMWKLNKLNLLHCFDAIYGLQDPLIPIDLKSQKPKVKTDILLKHLAQNNFGFQGIIRSLPSEYEKPGNKGLKMILIDYDLEGKDLEHVTLLGDNIEKDIPLGKSLGLKSLWAKYGALTDQNMLERLAKFAPEKLKVKNVAQVSSVVDKEPDGILDSFKDLLAFLD